MNTIQKRILLFLIGCIGTRSLFVYLAKNASTKYLKWMGYLALLPAIGFFYIYFSLELGPFALGVPPFSGGQTVLKNPCFCIIMNMVLLVYWSVTRT
jgi:hypothetical protein